MQGVLVLAADQPQSGWLTALIAAGGLVLGALLAAVGAIYTAKKKAQELEITYSQRLRDSYLENARSYLHSVYLPIHLALARLVVEYRQFRAHVDLESGVAEEGYREAFEAGIMLYDDALKSLLGRAAGAFLTTTLEERLESFNEFLRQSLPAVKLRVTNIVEMSAGGGIYARRECKRLTHLCDFRLVRCRYTSLGSILRFAKRWCSMRHWPAENLRKGSCKTRQSCELSSRRFLWAYTHRGRFSMFLG